MKALVHLEADQSPRDTNLARILHPFQAPSLHYNCSGAPPALADQSFRGDQ